MNSADTILLIEDDHDIRVTFRQTLENNGYVIHSVANGKDAFELLEKISLPRLIILDLGMPIMTGEEFLRLKALNEKLVNIPVLVISCHQDRIELLSEHPSMVKPIDIDEFTNKVASCLKSNELVTSQ